MCSCSWHYMARPWKEGTLKGIPSPVSRARTERSGFFGCQWYSKVNVLLLCTLPLSPYCPFALSGYKRLMNSASTSPRILLWHSRGWIQAALRCGKEICALLHTLDFWFLIGSHLYYTRGSSLPLPLAWICFCLGFKVFSSLKIYLESASFCSEA